MVSTSIPPIFDFDSVVNRRGTDCVKWSVPPSVIPLPIADMDFPAPEVVLEAIRQRLNHPVLGYANPTHDVQEAIISALERDYQWRADPSWLVFLPGVVPMLQHAVRMLDPSESSVTSTPIYPPFLYPTVLSGRSQIRVPLAEHSRGHEMDWDAMEYASGKGNPRLLMTCNPQNPTGRCFTRAELERTGEFCLRHRWMIASDEIHCGLVLDQDRAHIPIASLSPEIADITLTFMAPSKTFNIPGLCTAFAVISNPELRRRFKAQEAGMMPAVNVLGYTACAAAYRHAEPWRKALVEYLRANRDLVEREIHALPGLRMHHVEATYLAWIDCRGAGLTDPAAFFRAAGVELSDGKAFAGPGFVRLNFACPRETLTEALRRIHRAFTK